jgi:hypothetical protein
VNKESFGSITSQAKKVFSLTTALLSPKGLDARVFFIKIFKKKEE